MGVLSVTVHIYIHRVHLWFVKRQSLAEVSSIAAPKCTVSEHNNVIIEVADNCSSRVDIVNFTLFSQSHAISVSL